MTDEPNKPNSMVDVREHLYAAIAQAEVYRQRLVLLKQDIELFGGNSPEAAEYLHKVMEGHHMVCEHLANLRQEWIANDPPAPTDKPAPQPKTDAQLNPRSDLPRGQFEFDHKN
jgi:hypothetical protein